jgi:hypothetical protein
MCSLRLLGITLLLAAGCVSTPAVQERYDALPAVRSEYVAASRQTLYLSRPVSLEARVQGGQARALTLSWAVVCPGYPRTLCVPDVLRLSLRSLQSDVPRFLDREARMLRLEAGGQLLYEGPVYYDEPSTDGDHVRELLIAPLPVAELGEDEGGPVFRVHPMRASAAPDTVASYPVAAPLSGTLGDYRFDLSVEQLAPLRVLADTLARYQP